jgi:hypothetical protein
MDLQAIRKGPVYSAERIGIDYYECEGYEAVLELRGCLSIPRWIFGVEKFTIYASVFITLHLLGHINWTWVKY